MSNETMYLQKIARVGGVGVSQKDNWKEEMEEEKR